MHTTKTSAVIGFGRFGSLWAELLKKLGHTVLVVDTNEDRLAVAKNLGFLTVSAENAYKKASTIFYAVPISQFREVLFNHREFVKPHHVLFDLLSVKLYAKEVFEDLIPADQEIGLLHPMFGPDSVKINGLPGLNLMFDSYKLNNKTLQEWDKNFTDLELNVEHITADEHDKLAAWSQGVTHYIGRILGEMGTHSTKIDTLGAKKLGEIRDQVCNDTSTLFADLQHYNPHTLEMRVALDKSQKKLASSLLPVRKNKLSFVVGIQGGKGSFNEQAINHYIKKEKIIRPEIQYLHRTENVLSKLHQGDIDFAQFAIHNVQGGMVDESVYAMAKFQFKIIEQYSITIEHALMIRPDAELKDIDTVIAHPQVFAQCKINLQKKYPNLKLSSGEGELMDHAKVADLLNKQELPKNVATMGSEVMSGIYGLNIVEKNLQDNNNNVTTFLLVTRDSN